MHTARIISTRRSGGQDAARPRRGHGRRYDLAALNGFIAGAFLAGSIALLVGWILARLAGVIDGGP